MTDNDIAKALKCCANKKQCSDCPFCVTSREPCYITLAREAASLLARRDAEIERLEKSLTEQFDSYQSIRRKAKDEAIKEFAERLKERKYQSSDWSHGEHPYVVEESDINEILEEMTEE